MRAKRGLRIRLFVFLFLTAAASISGFSQSTTLLRGTITDPQGGSIAGAVVTLSNAGTGFNRSITTDQRGEYQFVQVAPGTYKIDVEMVGFAKSDAHRRPIAGEHPHHARSSYGTRQNH